MSISPTYNLHSAWTPLSADVRPGIAHKRSVPSTNPLCTSNMGQESEGSSLPSLRDLILHGERKDGQTLSHPCNGLFTNRSPQVIRCTASMDVHQSPGRRITSSSLFDLINDDAGDTNTTTPPRAQREPARNPRPCSLDETPRASDVTRFGFSTYFTPRNPVLEASPQSTGFLGGR
jgi:hypothetical protein